MSSDEPTDDMLAYAAKRAARSPALVSGIIETWRRAFPDEDPAAVLACTPRALSEVSLCLRPREAQWLEDAVEIASVNGIELDRLISFLRAGEALEYFKDAHPSDADAGILLAARDRDDEAE